MTTGGETRSTAYLDRENAHTWSRSEALGLIEGRRASTTDDTPSSGAVTFAAGETAKTVPISVNGDTLVEPDEYIIVSFRNPTNAKIGGFWGLGIGGITDDD